MWHHTSRLIAPAAVPLEPNTAATGTCCIGEAVQWTADYSSDMHGCAGVFPGQKRNVQVHKFLCAGTLEEKIDEMIERKKEIAAGVVGTGEGWLTELSTAQLRELVTLDKTAVVG